MHFTEKKNELFPAVRIQDTSKNINITKGYILKFNNERLYLGVIVVCDLLISIFLLMIIKYGFIE